MKLTQDERNHILFYEGAINSIQRGRVAEELYAVGNAYEAVNMLLFPGMENERTRISVEKREIDSVILDFMEELLQVYCGLYRVMCKYTYLEENKTEIYTYRKDRKNTFQLLQKGETPSFFSTSFCAISKPYFFKRKSGIILLEIRTNGKVEHLDMNELLGEDTMYAEEREILYAPFLPVQVKQKLELTPEEQMLRDCENQKPVGKYFIELGEFVPCEEPLQILEQKCEELRKDILKEENLENAKIVWNSLKREQCLGDKIEKEYCNWKTRLQKYIKYQFSVIKKEVNI